MRQLKGVEELFEGRHFDRGYVRPEDEPAEAMPVGEAGPERTDEISEPANTSGGTTTAKAPITADEPKAPPFPSQWRAR